MHARMHARMHACTRTPVMVHVENTAHTASLDSIRRHWRKVRQVNLAAEEASSKQRVVSSMHAVDNEGTHQINLRPVLLQARLLEARL